MAARLRLAGFALAPLLAATCPGVVAAAPGDLPSAEEVKRLWRERLDGLHFTALVVMSIQRAGGSHEERRISVWRDDEEGARERLMARFDAPPDLRGLGLLYLENEGRANDYFLYQPATRRVRRVPETMAKEDVYGIDLEYLGFGVAQLERTQVESVNRDSLDGRPCVRLVERAEAANPRFDTRTVWLDPATWVPLRVEHVKQGKTLLVARTLELGSVQGIATPLRTTFERPLEGELVTMKVEAIDYQAPIPEIFFSTVTLTKGR